MERVTGLGGIFFKAENPEQLGAWYEKHLGIKQEHGCATFAWRHADDTNMKGTTVWSLFKKDTKYFEPSKASLMVNYRVKDLDALLEALRQEGVEIDPKRDDSEYGRFAWIMDPEGNRIELWQPPEGK
ncbi:MAG: VOC family protein [Gemmataceae bacterium]